MAKGKERLGVMMVQTYGLTHINLAVRDLGRTLRFHEQVFGLREYSRGDGLVHTQAPPVRYVADPDGYEIEIWFE
jgi:catechol 2,3-dioxygenase-like lactoylglutathione lyase family enzyme